MSETKPSQDPAPEQMDYMQSQGPKPPQGTQSFTDALQNGPSQSFVFQSSEAGGSQGMGQFPSLSAHLDSRLHSPKGDPLPGPAASTAGVPAPASHPLVELAGLTNAAHQVQMPSRPGMSHLQSGRQPSASMTLNPIITTGGVGSTGKGQGPGTAGQNPGTHTHTSPSTGRPFTLAPLNPVQHPSVAASAPTYGSYSQPSQSMPNSTAATTYSPHNWDPKVLAEVAAHFQNVTSTDPENQDRIKNALAAALESATRQSPRQSGGQLGSFPSSNASQRFTADDLAKSLMNVRYSAGMPGMPAPGEGLPQGELIQQLGDMASQRFPPLMRVQRPVAKRRDLRDEPTTQRVPVVCNGNKGMFLVGRQVIVCLCNECVNRAKSSGIGEMELSPTDFERHSALPPLAFLTTEKARLFPLDLMRFVYRDRSCTSKKWKYTVKVLETDANGEEKPGMNVGTWLDKNAPQGSVPRRQVMGYSEILGDTAPPPITVPSKRPGHRSSRSDMPPHRRSSQGRSNGFHDDGTDEGDPEEEFDPLTGSLHHPKASRAPLGGNRKWLEPKRKADIPDLRRGGPDGREMDDPRAGRPGPTTLDALALAASYEKEKADRLHFDATADPEFFPGAANDPRRASVERGQRIRKKPKWMVASDEEEEETDYSEEEVVPRSGKGRKRPLASGRGKTMRRPRRAAAKRAIDRPPEILEWNVLNDGFLHMVVQKDNKVFSGALQYQRSLAPEEEEDEDVADDTYDSSASELVEPKPKRKAKGRKGRRAHSVESPELVVSDDPLRNRRKGSGEKPKVNEKRRIVSSQEYERLAEEGPPPDARCALCHCEADPQAGGVFTTDEARGNVNFDVLERKREGLGPFMLVKTTAIMNAWVHIQCALWSPEVYVNTNGDVERASEAIRRGRMLKCKVCNEKGATLGCHKRSCRASYHLPCAREHGCPLEGLVDEDYLVMCREHNPHEGDLVEHMPAMPDALNQDRVPARPRNRSASQGAGAELSGWDLFPKDTQNLDTLTAAASAMRVGNGIEHAANPLAAHHFGGTVGQSILRPGRCAVCVIQRKGVCGTQTAPKKCLRRLALEAAGRQIPEAPPGWRTRRPMAHWPAEPAKAQPGRSSSPSPAPAHPSGTLDPSGTSGPAGPTDTTGASLGPVGGSAEAAVTSGVTPDDKIPTPEEAPAASAPSLGQNNTPAESQEAANPASALADVEQSELLSDLALMQPVEGAAPEEDAHHEPNS